MFEKALNELEKQGLIVLMTDSVTCVHYREDFYADGAEYDAGASGLSVKGKSIRPLYVHNSFVIQH